MMERNQIEKLRADVTGCMGRYEEQLRQAGMELQADQIEQKIREFREGLFQVLFTGVFSAGKSTTLNALMHQKLLFVSINPATPVITRIVNGEDSEAAIVTFRDESRPEEKMTIREFAAKYQLEAAEPEKFRAIKYVTIQRKLPSETVIFADSPGLENTDIDSEVANEFAGKADAIVFMLNATKSMGKNDRAYIQKFERRGLRNIFVVVNWYNMVQEQDEASFQEKLQFDLRDVFSDEKGVFDEELYRQRVFCVDAFTSECARTGNPKKIRKGVKFAEIPVAPEEDEYTGIPEFEEALYGFLQSSDKDKAGYKGYLPRMASMYAATSQSVEKFRTDSARDQEELQAQRDAQQKVIDDLTDTVKDIGRSFDNAVRQIMVNAQSAYTAFTTSVANNWEGYFEDCNIPFGAGEIAKITWLKTKYKFADLFGGGGDDEDERKQIEMMREESFHIAFICVGLAFGPVAELGQWLMFTVLLLALSLADCTAQTIPDPLVLALAVGRAVWALVLRQPLKEAVLAALAACAVPTALLGAVLLAERLMDREIMGSGDMKLLFAVALYLTWPQMLLGLLAMSLLGLSFALLTGRVWGPKLPLSPFFAAGMVVSLCFGGPPIQWYLSLF